MGPHPITEYPYRWIPLLGVSLVLAIIQILLLREYADVEWLPAIVDGITSVGWLAALVYLAWFVSGVVAIFQTDVITIVVGNLLWIGGSYIVSDIMSRIIGITSIPFAPTIPLRLLFSVPAWISVVLWYRLLVVRENSVQAAEYIGSQDAQEERVMPEECIDRITVKDGTRIHLVKVEDLLYIQACGDYVTLITPQGEYIKEQTMKYFETHLPADNFVRVHRSNIVNVTQISRVELFGKETYQLLLKNGVKLRVSLSGYRLLKERLGL